METQTSLSLLTSLILVGSASAQTPDFVDFPSGQDSHWSTGNLFANTAAGTLGVGNRSAVGYAYYNQDTVTPPGALDERYRIAGSFDLRNGSSFSHGFFDAGPASSTGGLIQQGFGVEVINRSASPAAGEQVLLINNRGLPSSGAPISLVDARFSFPKDGLSTASVSYDLTFRRTSIILSGPDGWNVSGIIDGMVSSGGPTTRFLVNENFNMDFDGDNFGMQVQNFPVVIGPAPVSAVSNIADLQWSVTTVPEPSGVLLLSLGAFGVCLSRKR